MNLRRIVKYGLPLALAVFCLVFLTAVSRALLPFALGIALAHVADPAVHALQARGYKRGACVAALWLVLSLPVLGVGLLGLSALTDESGDFRDRRPEYARRLAATLGSLDSGYLEAIPRGREFVELMRSRGEELAAIGLKAFPSSGTGLEQVFWLALSIFLAPFVAVCVSLRGPAALKAALEACPGTYVETALDLLWTVDASVGRYLRGVSIRAIAVGLLTFAGLRLADLHYAVWFSILAAAANFLPWIGPPVAASATLVAACLQCGLIERAADSLALGGAFRAGILPLQVLLTFLAAKALDSWFIRPIVHKQTSELNLLALVFALLCGWTLAGLAGFFFAATAAGALRLFFQAVWEWYQREFQPRPLAPRRSELSLV